MRLASFQKKTKTIIIIILLLLVLGVTVVLGKQASNFFAKASSCSVKDVKVSQVTANSAVISWETDDVSQGRVEYGTSATNLNFSAPEASSGKVHNLPLTLLTPNTIYYYLLVVGDTRCDTSGQKCEQNCIPWSFTTAAVVPQKEPIAPISTPTVLPTPTPTKAPSATPSATIAVSGSISPTSKDSICPSVKLNIGASSNDATRWATLKKYDIDNNGVINGIDVIKCQQQGK